jgi:hypothetical protein
MPGQQVRIRELSRGGYRAGAAGLCDDQGCDPEFYRRTCPEKGIRANAVAQVDLTRLIPSTLPEDAVKNFGKRVQCIDRSASCRFRVEVTGYCGGTRLESVAARLRGFSR